MIDEIDDRSYSELVGDIPAGKTGRKRKTVTVHKDLSPTIIPDREKLNAAEVAIRTAVKKLAIDHASEMIMLQVELARNSTNENVRLEATEKVLNRAMGKVPNMAIDGSGVVQLPVFNINFGNGSVMPTIDVNYTESDDDDED